MTHQANFLGHVIPNGNATVTFKWGVDTSYGASVPATQNPVAGTAAVEVSAVATPLLPSTTYHAIMTVVNESASVDSEDVIFTTPGDGGTSPVIVDFTVSAL